MPPQKPPVPTKKPKYVGETAKRNDLLQKACTFLEKNDNTPTICKAWAEKLIALDPTQRILAEKAINDVLFEASLGTLHRDSVKINQEDNSYFITPGNSNNSTVFTSETGSEPSTIIKNFFTNFKP